MAYHPIQNYGIIGNMRTAALIGLNGSIDWFCFPHFDSPSVFATLLDDTKGGHFQIAPAQEGSTSKQFYWPETNILITRFLSPGGVGEIQDFMPAGISTTSDWHHQLVRRVKVSRGSIDFQIRCEPAFNYALAQHVTRISTHGASFHAPDLSLGLATEVPLHIKGRGVEGTFTLREGQSVIFLLRRIQTGEECGRGPTEAEAEDLFERTVLFWQRWLAKCTYTGRWREIVHRSALLLKLLTFEPTGAIVAAPTCSLPETIDGIRNWDYRYTWIRDAAFTVYAFLRIGLTEEATAFMQWMQTPSPGEEDHQSPLQIVYGLDGRRDLTEQVLDHLDGYRGTRPVRIGNGAFKQLQLDIYGELIDSLYLYDKYGSPIPYDVWVVIRRRLDWLCDNWQQKDEGIWEVRGARREFVYSKVMCWVALDRGLRIAAKRSFPADCNHWRKTRDIIYEEVMTKGWNHERQSFVQHYGSQSLDASNLIMPLVYFMSPDDPRMLSTIDAINRPSSAGGLVSDGLLYRYDAAKGDDGLHGEEGTFNMCTFWLVEALTRAGRTDHRRLNEARLLFERMLGYANHVGLYAEQTGASGEALGNFPQAFTHLSLISAAFNLDRTLNLMHRSPRN
jgi:GH15 family glucan-1,4-alpha-glucosidase